MSCGEHLAECPSRFQSMIALPAPFAEGEPLRPALLSAAAGVSAGSRGVVGVSTTDRAVIAAAVISARAFNHQLVLASTPDERSRMDLEAAVSGGPVLSGDDPEAILTRLARRASGPGGSGPGGSGPEGALDDLARPSRSSQDQVWVRLLTGGSTGPPKMYSKTVGNLLGEVEFWCSKLAVSSDDVVLATVSPLHIYGLIHSVLVPLLGGCRVVRATPFLPGEVEDLAGRYGATILASAPAHLRAIQMSRVRLPRVRLVLSSGSMLPEGTAVSLERRLGAPVVEIYGSTESGAIACRCRAMGEEHFYPLSPVECTVRGEVLRVRSPFVSPGLATDLQGWYEMPDRVFSQGTSGFALAGRQDDIVKIGGKRVDLNDLERRVRALAHVEDVAVQAVPSDGAREVDIGILVVTTKGLPELRALVNEALGAIVRPRWVQSAQSIPRTQTGKLDPGAVLALLQPPPGRVL